MGSIENRHNTHQRYLLTTTDDLLDNLTTPCMLIQQIKRGNHQVYYHTVNIFIIDNQKYYHIEYLGSKDQHDQLEVIINDLQWQNKPFNFEEVDRPNAHYSFDIQSVSKIYKRIGFHNYINHDIQNYLNQFVNVAYDYTFQSFFEILALHLIGKMQCVYLNLIDEDVDNVEYTVNNLDRLDEGVNHLMEEILFYYDLLNLYKNDHLL